MSSLDNRYIFWRNRVLAQQPFTSSFRVFIIKGRNFDHRLFIGKSSFFHLDIQGVSYCEKVLLEFQLLNLGKLDRILLCQDINGLAKTFVYFSLHKAPEKQSFHPHQMRRIYVDEQSFALKFVFGNKRFGL